VYSLALCGRLVTCCLSGWVNVLLDKLIQKNAGKIIDVPGAQEISDDLCDAGSDPDVLRDIAVVNAQRVDLSLVKDGWNDKPPKGWYSTKRQSHSGSRTLCPAALAREDP
jgi:hypothetical protein